MWHDQLNQIDRRTVGNLTIGVVIFYGAIFFMLLGLAVTNQSIGGWLTSGTQAEIISSVSGTAINQDRLTAAAVSSDLRRAGAP